MHEEPEFNPPPDWTPIDFPRSFGAGRSFVSGDIGGDRLRVNYFSAGETGALRALAWWGPGAEGPPGHAHGGSMAAVLDEAMGFAAWHAGHPVVAATITVNFRKRLPLGVVLAVHCTVEYCEGTKVMTSGVIQSPCGTDSYADATGIFIERPMKEFGTLLKSLDKH